jgi:DNA-binding XRE family transcriptional regulator
MQTVARNMTPENYQQLRRSIGLSCEELAEKLGVSRKTIHMRESGKTPISMESYLAIQKVAELMGFEIFKRDRREERPGRNDPCDCGSGIKFKKCCGR